MSFELMGRAVAEGGVSAVEVEIGIEVVGNWYLIETNNVTSIHNPEQHDKKGAATSAFFIVLFWVYC
jgi:hypothetical protein